VAIKLLRHARLDGVGATPYDDDMPSTATVWTVGHSNHDFESFVELLRVGSVTHVIDVRSFPYSRHAPQYNREQLAAAIDALGLQYVFSGLALGGRPRRDDHYDADGHALYSEMAREPDFQRAIESLSRGANETPLALLCSCGRPDECHRRLLVGKVLCEHGLTLRHILPDGSVRTETEVQLASTSQESLFGHDAMPWRSTRSVSHRRRLSASSVA
jgi:uncharacterized protein (DUF488 family)